MQISTALTIVGLLAFGLQTSHAQLTGAERQRALEILRKQLAEEQGVKTQAPATPKPTPPPASAPEKPQEIKPAPAPSRPAAVVPSTGFNQDRALDLLRRALAQEQGLPAPAVETPKPVKRAEKSPAKGTTATPVKEQVDATAKPAEPIAVTPEATGPKTKGERLAELNALYFADKIAPDEYHARRAKIVAEP